MQKSIEGALSNGRGRGNGNAGGGGNDTLSVGEGNDIDGGGDDSLNGGFGDGSTVELVGVAASDLSSSDFLFY